MKTGPPKIGKRAAPAKRWVRREIPMNSVPLNDYRSVPYFKNCRTALSFFFV